ncbi:MAG: hypothetical protein QXK37_02430 [Candidatus Woesearchaeota archaeon]
MCRKRRAQITIFVVIGLLILLIIGLVIIQTQNIRRLKMENEQLKSMQQMAIFRPANVIFQECTKQLAYNSLKVLGEGGLIYPENFTLSDFAVFALFYYDGIDLKPSISRIENELETYVNENIEGCVYQLYGARYNLSLPENYTIKTRISDEKISYEVSYPAKIYLSDATSRLQDFSIEIPYNFYNIYNTVETIVDATAAEPTFVDATMLLDKDLNITVSFPKINEIVYQITDPTFFIEGEPYSYYFAVKVQNEV